jgi:hypothetical protein
MAYETMQLTGMNYDEICNVRKREENQRDKFRRSTKPIIYKGAESNKGAKSNGTKN